MYHNRVLFEERLGVIDSEFKKYVNEAEEAASPRKKVNNSFMQSALSISPRKNILQSGIPMKKNSQMQVNSYLEPLLYLTKLHSNTKDGKNKIKLKKLYPFPKNYIRGLKNERKKVDIGEAHLYHPSAQPLEE